MAEGTVTAPTVTPAETPDRVAVAFPGMGPAAFSDLARFLVVNRHARELVALADDTLGYSLIDRWEAAEGDYSEYAQVAFLVTCVALARWATAEHGLDPSVCVGPSFGGKSAAIHSGAVTPADGIALTARIARCLEEYFAVEHTDAVTQSFARTPQERLDEVLAELDEAGEWYDLSCRVDHDFHMVTLRSGRLEWFQKRLRSVGGMPLYAMVPPMHAAAFGALRAKAETEVFGSVPFRDPWLPVVADQDGRVLTTGPEVRTMLLDGFDHATRWPDAVATLSRLGVTELHVCGPDRLFGRVPVATSAFRVVPVDPRSALRPRRSARVA